MGGAGGVVMAVSIANNQTAQSFSGSTSYTLSSYTPAAGASRILVVRVHALRTADDTNTFAVSSVTFGGVGLTEAVTIRHTSVSRVYRAAIWYLVNPSGSAGDVVVTLGAGASSCIIAAATLTDAAQSAPVNQTATQTGDVGGSIAAVLPGPPSAGHLIVAAVVSTCLSDPTWTWVDSSTPDGTTEQYDIRVDTNVSTRVSGAGAYTVNLAESGGSYFVQADQSSTRPQALCVAEFKAAPLGSPPPPRRPRVYIRM